MRLEVILLLIVSISTKAIVNQNPVKPGCPAVNPQENLLLERFAGVWYEVQKHFSQFELGSCVSVNIGLLKELNSTILSLRHNQKIGGNFTDFDQNATVRRINSVWSFKYNSSLMADFDGYIYILDTNFVNYAVVYACGLINLKQKGQMVWVLSRSRTLQPEFVNKSIEVLKKNNISVKSLIKADQTNCSMGIEGL